MLLEARGVEEGLLLLLLRVHRNIEKVGRRREVVVVSVVTKGLLMVVVETCGHGGGGGGSSIGGKSSEGILVFLQKGLGLSAGSVLVVRVLL